jgi:DNA-binding NarL/FixJ family response regulator
MQPNINVAILDSYQATIDGYIYRLSMVPEITVKGTYLFAEDLEAAVIKSQIDLLIMGVNVHISKENRNPYPILYFVDWVTKRKPELKLLIISVVNQPQLIKSLLEAGVSGFILKEDQQSIQRLGKIVEIVARGGVFFSEGLQQSLFSKRSGVLLTKRQLEALFLCAAYPDVDTYNLAQKLNISGSTFRNLLSETYIKMGVRTRAAAIIKARQLGLLPPASPADYYLAPEEPQQG